MGVVEDLEEVVWEVGTRLRSVPFGQVLQRALQDPDPSRQSEPHGVAFGRPRTLMMWETNLDPALQRSVTASVMAASESTGFDVEGAKPWLTWVGDGFRAMRRIAAKCWSGIPPQIRQVLMDFDDLHPLVPHPYLRQLRLDTPGTWLRFAGLDTPDVEAAFTRMWTLARQTPSYQVADQAARSMTPSQLSELAQIRHDLARVLVPQGGQSWHDYWEGSKRSISEAYVGVDADLRYKTQALRHFNGLVHRTVWAMLGLAETPLVTEAITDLGAPVRLETDTDAPEVALLLDDAGHVFVRPTYPVRIDADLPIDGLFFATGSQFSFGHGGGLIDLRLEPFQHYAGTLASDR